LSDKSHLLFPHPFRQVIPRRFGPTPTSQADTPRLLPDVSARYASSLTRRLSPIRLVSYPTSQPPTTACRPRLSISRRVQPDKSLRVAPTPTSQVLSTPSPSDSPSHPTSAPTTRLHPSPALPMPTSQPSPDRPRLLTTTPLQPTSDFPSPVLSVSDYPFRLSPCHIDRRRVISAPPISTLTCHRISTRFRLVTTPLPGSVLTCHIRLVSTHVDPDTPRLPGTIPTSPI
jgi:hypothetical protein